MMMTDILAALLGGFGAGILALFTSARSLYSQDITKERQVWREKVRILSAEALEAVRLRNTETLIRIKHEFEIRLNPGCLEDKKILHCLSSLQKNPSAQIREISGRVSFLLKHDWERVKLESSIVKRIFIFPYRVPWDEKYSGIEHVPSFRKIRWQIIFALLLIILVIMPSATY